MFKQSGIVASLILVLVIFGACGGGSKEAESFTPRAIPSEYAGLSLEKLHAKSVAEFTDLKIEDPYGSIRSNIETYTNKLVSFQGVVEKVFEGSKQGTYQIWMCNASTTTSDPCKEPVLLLYSTDRGPALEKDDTVHAAGILVGSQKKTVNLGAGTSSGGSTRVVAPMVSVIKAKIVIQ